MFKYSLRIYIIIIYNICWRKYFCIFESRNEIDHLNLCLERQSRAQTIRVDHIGVYALLFKPNKMLITIRKLDELLFNGWAVSWSFDYISIVAVELWELVYILPYQIVCSRIGMCNKALYQTIIWSKVLIFMQITEKLWWIIRDLLIHSLKIN